MTVFLLILNDFLTEAVKVRRVDEGKFPFLFSCNLIGRERSRDLGLFTQLSLCKQPCRFKLRPRRLKIYK